MAKLERNRLDRDEGGATAVEYALLIGCLALAIIGGLSATGSSVTDLLDHARNAFPNSEEG
ncbi:MAG TPA: Flp family type IVb pilin [Sphingomonadales bacterium]|jgi:Flp pilus assembly pilin Flp